MISISVFLASKYICLYESGASHSSVTTKRLAICVHHWRLSLNNAGYPDDHKPHRQRPRVSFVGIVPRKRLLLLKSCRTRRPFVLVPCGHLHRKSQNGRSFGTFHDYSRRCAGSVLAQVRKNYFLPLWQKRRSGDFSFCC